MKQLDNASIDTIEVSTILKVLRNRGIFSPICTMNAAMASFATKVAPGAIAANFRSLPWMEASSKWLTVCMLGTTWDTTTS